MGSILIYIVPVHCKIGVKPICVLRNRPRCHCFIVAECFLVTSWLEDKVMHGEPTSNQLVLDSFRLNSETGKDDQPLKKTLVKKAITCSDCLP